MKQLYGLARKQTPTLIIFLPLTILFENVKKIGLILGISGQDGSYLAKYLVDKGYHVVGTSRSKDPNRLANLKVLDILDKVKIYTLSTSNVGQIEQCLCHIKPHEVYNLTGPSSVSESFSRPHQYARAIYLNTLSCLEAIRRVNIPMRYYNACSGECFGETGDKPADEQTPFQPLSPYGHAKAAAFGLTKSYRETYGLFCSSGILFNHESPLRPSTFVSQKILLGAAAIAQGEQKLLHLGNIDIKRDWGWAPNYVEGMYNILHHDAADDFILATGKTYSLKSFLAIAFEQYDLDWKPFVTSSPELIRPSEIRSSRANPEKAKRVLGWSSQGDLPNLISKLTKARI